VLHLQRPGGSNPQGEAPLDGLAGLGKAQLARPALGRQFGPDNGRPLARQIGAGQAAPREGPLGDGAQAAAQGAQAALAAVS
jgi:hypothetical protein